MRYSNKNDSIITKKLPSVIGIASILLVIIIYFGYVFIYSVNIPFWDEHDNLINLIDLYINKTFPENIAYLFKQTNEHRVFFYRLTLLSEYLLIKEVNFKYIIIFGNLGMVCLMCLLYKLSPIFKSNLIAFIPIILLLFVPQNEITDWGMSTFTNVVQYALILTSLFILNKWGNFNFLIAVFLAVIATFSFGNGMLTFFVGFIILFYKERKSLLQIALWSTFMIVSIALYFYHFQSSIGVSQKIEFFHHPFKAALFFFTIWGNLFSALLKRELILYAIIGFLIFMFLCFLMLKKWSVIKKNPLLSAYLAFFILTASMATISRVGLGVVEASASRYMLLPILFISVIYILTLYCYKIKKGIMFLILASSFLLYIARLHQQHYVISQHRDRLSEGLVSYYKDTENTSLPYPSQSRASNILSTSIDKGYYTPPCLCEIERPKKWVTDKIIIPETKDIVYYLDTVGSDNQMIKIVGWAFLNKKNKNNQRIGIVLCSVKDTFFFEPSIIRRMDVVEHFLNEYSDIINDCGLNFALNWKKFGVAPDQYKIGIGIIKKDRLSSFIYTNRVLNLSNDLTPLLESPQTKRWIIDKTMIPVTDNIVYYLDTVVADNEMIKIAGWAFLTEKNENNQQIGIILSSPTDTLLFEATSVPRMDVIEYFKNKYPDAKNNCGFNFSLKWKMNRFVPGRYTLGVGLIKNNKLSSYVNTNRVLILHAE